MSVLTIFTPIYNRAHTIGRTYESLCRQTRKDFEWLVIDDGSSDNTKELVLSWIEQTKDFKIRYVYKENGGLHTGYNKAIELMETELCVCIDSDDWMPDDAVEKIVGFWSAKGANDFSGIIGLDFTPEGRPIGGYFSNDMKSGHITDLTYKFRHRGDTKIVCRTDLLKRFAPMPTLNNEKNFNPIYLYLQVDSVAPFLYLNENLCFVDYQVTGMSANIFNQFYNSPYSFAALRELLMSLKRLSFHVRYKNAIQYASCAFIAHDFSLMGKTKHQFMVWSSLPLGYALYLLVLWKKK